VGEILPGFRVFCARPPLREQEHVSPGDRFVISLRFALCRGELLKSHGEPFDGLEQWIPAHVQVGQSHVVSVMEAFRLQRAVFEVPH